MPDYTLEYSHPRFDPFAGGGSGAILRNLKSHEFFAENDGAAADAIVAFATSVKAEMGKRVEYAQPSNCRNHDTGVQIPIPWNRLKQLPADL